MRTIFTTYGSELTVKVVLLQFLIGDLLLATIRAFNLNLRDDLPQKLRLSNNEVITSAVGTVLLRCCKVICTDSTKIKLRPCSTLDISDTQTRLAATYV